MKTNKTRDTGNGRLKIQRRQTKQGTLAIVDSRYRMKTNKTRDTGNNRLNIQSEDKQNKGHWQ